MFDKQLILNIYTLAIKDEWYAPSDFKKITQLLLDSGIAKKEIDDARELSGQKTPQFPDQLWQKESWLIAFARLIVSTRKISQSDYVLYLQLYERLNISSINSRVIFDKAIVAMVKNEELKLKRMKTKLQKSCDKYIIEDESSTGADRVTEEQTLWPRIIVFGQFLQSKDDIACMFQKAFAKEGYELDKKALMMSVNRDYNKAKRGYSKLATPIQRREVDYFLFGPHPHSIRSRFGMDKWDEYFDAGHQLVLGEYTHMLSLSTLKKHIQTIAKDWVAKD